MKLINKIMCIVLVFSLFSSYEYAYSIADEMVQPEINDMQKNIETEYGVNLILPINSDTNDNMEKCLAVIERSLRCFPNGVIKEITSSYLNKGIKTNIIITETEYDLTKTPAEYVLTNSSADITLNLLPNNFYGTSDVVSFDGVMHELGHFVCDYLFDCYGYQILDREFKEINNGYEYGTWGNGYNEVFVNINSATDLYSDISNLIWYAEAHPEKIRNLCKNNIIRKKIEFISYIFDESFTSVTENSKYWLDTVPDNPDEWAEDIVNEMEKAELIPKEFQGKYESYISKEDFCILAFNLIKMNIGEDEFYDYFDISKPEISYNIDPINGEIILEDDISNIFYNINFCRKKEDIYEAYKIGLINDLVEDKFDPEEYITRLEAVKLFAFICEKFGIDITKYEQVNFDEIECMSDNEKTCINFAVEEGIVKGDGNNLKPYDFCTYQEAYIMINRVYILLKE